MKMRLILAICSLAAYATGAHANLLTNPGFEAELTNWSSSNAAIRHGDPAPYEGLNYVFGPSTSSFSVSQDVDLLGAGVSSTAIDAGSLDIDFGGWQSGYRTQRDYGQISISLLDSTMAQIGSALLPSFFSNSTWVEQSGSTALLAGTRFVRYTFVGTRVDGSNDDGYLDAAYLNVVSSEPPASVPEPPPLSLLAIGLAGLGLLRRRPALR